MYTFESAEKFYTSIEEAQRAAEVSNEEHKKSLIENLVSHYFKFNELREVEFKPTLDIEYFIKNVNDVAENKTPQIYQVTSVES